MHKFDLSGKKGLIIGVANEQSLAYGCASEIHQLGGRVALTYLNEKAKPFVEPLAKKVAAEIFLPCNVNNTEEIDALFEQINERWGQLDFLIHSIAFAPMEDLHGRLVDSSRDGFLMAMDISCHSLMRLCQRAEPLMKNGGSIFAMSYLGSQRAIENYNLMGPVKAALESSVRYLATELGQANIRVNAISAGPVSTRAASGLAEFDKLLAKATQASPLNKTLGTDDVGAMGAFLVSDASAAITGETLYVDCGYHIVG